MPSLGPTEEVTNSFSYTYAHTLEYGSIISSWSIIPTSAASGITVTSPTSSFAVNPVPTPTPISITVAGTYSVGVLSGGKVNHVPRGSGSPVVEGSSFDGLDPLVRQVIEFSYPQDTEIAITINFDQSNGPCAPLLLTHGAYAKRSSFDSSFAQFL